MSESPSEPPVLKREATNPVDRAAIFLVKALAVGFIVFMLVCLALAIFGAGIDDY